ncbi:hypothetical protein CROQUDRAFT_97911 [Cronartium quercuum f. sp. fusiforme G11]|uniref:Uncharacterized protein n=1 Tax=Cronartium quercuum f. sp. fusiforme G11 TaxID=708437 RepID=A0A9P6NED4_9BASI|nr:hypothetical protein CROQUDRAFT_97911 [Cronartium quercuum f. sp. fusiforme G11]
MISYGLRSLKVWLYHIRIQIRTPLILTCSLLYVAWHFRSLFGWTDQSIYHPSTSSTLSEQPTMTGEGARFASTSSFHLPGHQFDSRPTLSSSTNNFEMDTGIEEDDNKLISEEEEEEDLSSTPTIEKMGLLDSLSPGTEQSSHTGSNITFGGLEWSRSLSSIHSSNDSIRNFNTIISDDDDGVVVQEGKKSTHSKVDMMINNKNLAQDFDELSSVRIVGSSVHENRDRSSPDLDTSFDSKKIKKSRQNLLPTSKTNSDALYQNSSSSSTTLAKRSLDDQPSSETETQNDQFQTNINPEKKESVKSSIPLKKSSQSSEFFLKDDNDEPSTTKSGSENSNLEQVLNDGEENSKKTTTPLKKSINNSNDDGDDSMIVSKSSKGGQKPLVAGSGRKGVVISSSGQYPPEDPECKPMPLKNSTWKSLKIDDYMKNLPDGKNTSLEVC